VAREHAHPKTTSLNGAPETNNLPGPLTRIVGRDDVIATLTKQLAQRRLLTIVGPGGIGKTTVAIAVADRAGVIQRRRLVFGLAPLADPDLVPSALGTVLGITLFGVNPLSGLTA
jgi:MoxR-like ATPase